MEFRKENNLYTIIFYYVKEKDWILNILKKANKKTENFILGLFITKLC